MTSWQHLERISDPDIENQIFSSPGAYTPITNDDGFLPDRPGDMKLELNMEYRFQIIRLWNYPIEGTLFVDCGNIWYLRKNNDFVNGEINLNRFFKDIAVGIGTGLRVDLKFMMIRTDYSYKAKNPSPDINDAHLQNRWFANWDPWGGQVQLAFSYPF